MPPASTKVMHIASGDLWAGAENQIYYLVRQLHQMDSIRVHVVLLNSGTLEQNLRQHGIEVTVIEESGHSTPAILWRLIKQVLHFKPHIIHAHRIKENVLGGLASMLLPGSRCISTMHGAQEIRYGLAQCHKNVFPMLEWFILRFIYKKIVYVSAELKDKVAQRFGQGKALVIENGLDIQETISRSAKETDYSGRGRRIIGFLGRLVEVKRVDLFIEVARILTARYPEQYEFLIVGDGPKFKEVEQLISCYGLANKVTMTGFTKNPLPLLKQMDQMLITSDHEGLPTNLLEAMCLKVGVISHKLGGIAKVLANGQYGTLIASQNPGDYADAISNQDTRSPESIKKRDQAFIYLKENYSSEKVAAEYAQAYSTMGHVK